MFLQYMVQMNQSIHIIHGTTRTTIIQHHPQPQELRTTTATH
jgi:hypothetical protein